MNLKESDLPNKTFSHSSEQENNATNGSCFEDGQPQDKIPEDKEKDILLGVIQNQRIRLDEQAEENKNLKQEL